MVSKIVTGFLNAIYYENILEKESNEKYNYMLKTLKRRLGMDMFVYSHKCKDALRKVKTLIAFRDIYVNLRQKMRRNNIKNDSIKKIKKLGNIPLSKDSKTKYVNDASFKEISNLLNSPNTIIQFQIDDNEIFSPKPYWDEFLYLDGTDMENLYDTQYKIIKQYSIFFTKDKNFKRRKIKNFSVTFSEFSYRSNIKKHSKIIMMTSLQIIDREFLDEDIKRKRSRSRLKSIFFVIILISTYIFLFILVTDIYNKYEDNIFKICISPLLTVVFSRFLITQNVMIFVHSFFMYYFGEKFYTDNRKTLNPLGIVFRYVIPGVSKANHKALLIFRNFNRKQ